MPRGKKLTNQEQRKILALRAEGLGYEVISQRIGRSKRVVLNFLNVSHKIKIFLSIFMIL